MKNLKLLTLILFICNSAAISAQDVSDLFKELDAYYAKQQVVYAVKFDSLITKIVENKYIPGGVRVHYKESATTIIDLTLDGNYSDKGKFFVIETNSGIPSEKRILKTKIDLKSEVEYFIDFNPGPSADPHFVILRAEGDSAVFLGKTAWCLDLFIPGDGYLYTAGHINSMFDMRRRYAVVNDSLVETPQPYYNVGLETVTTGPVKLSSDIDGDETFSIPPGTPVTVLVNTDDMYLISAPFGVTGWTYIEKTYYTPIKHLIWRGD